jgi:tetratricopeptide (TPR) repeat protein
MKTKSIYIVLQLMIIIAFPNLQAGSDDLHEGDVYHQKYDNVNAVKSYEKALKTSPNNYPVLSKLTLAYDDAGEEMLELKKRDNAEVYVNKAVSSAELLQDKYPDSALCYTYLALSYGNIAMFKGGREKIKYAFKVKLNAEKAIEMNPSDVYPYMILGIYYREAANLNWFEKLFAKSFLGGVPEGTYDASKQMFYKALSIDKDIIVAYYNLSKTYDKLNDRENEINCLKKVIQLPVRNFRDKYSKIKASRKLEELLN